MARPTLYDEQLRIRLIRGAAAALASGGPAALSLRSVTAAAGTSTSAIYSLFGDRDGLIAAAAQTAAESFSAAQRAVSADGDPVEHLLALGMAYRSWALANPELYLVMFGGRLPAAGPWDCEGGFGAQPIDPIAPLVAAVRALLEAGDHQGDLTEMVCSIWAAVHGMVSLELAAWSDLPLERRDRLYRTHLEVLERGWRA